jgi:hypothetical protein
MKKLIFLFLVILLFGFNYAYSQESKSQICKNACKVLNDPNFCKRICEIEISDPKWKFYNLSIGGAWFLDPTSISAFNNVVKVRVKIIYSEIEKQQIVKIMGREYKKLDHSLILYEIDCAKKRERIISLVAYASDGLVINSRKIPNFPAEWIPILPNSVAESLFKEVCRVEE